MKNKKTGLELVETFCKNNGITKPSHFSIVIDGQMIAVESVCRHMRTLSKAGVLEKSKDEKGRVQLKPVQIYVNEKPLSELTQLSLC